MQIRDRRALGITVIFLDGKQTCWTGATGKLTPNGRTQVVFAAHVDDRAWAVRSDYLPAIYCAEELRIASAENFGLTLNVRELDPAGPLNPGSRS